MTTWAYGVTTVPQRIETLLPNTLRSLAAGGFAEPHLFVDGHATITGRPATIREPRVGAFGNWYLSMLELYLRSPRADRYAIFQDDLRCVSHLREYLDTQTLSDCNYWNLYAVSATERRGSGLVKPAFCGMGALALVLPRNAVRQLLRQESMINKPLSQVHPKKNLDGAVWQAMRNCGINELCHVPSLVDHTGEVSTLGNHNKKRCRTFPGEHFDARALNDSASPQTSPLPAQVGT